MRSLVATGVLVACGAGAAACTPADDDCCRNDFSPAERRTIQLAEDAWPAWATDELHAGAAGSALVEAVGDLSRNDWGIAPSFSWQLEFRPGRLTAPSQVGRTLRRACAFAPARDLPSPAVTAQLVVPGTGRLVPTALSSPCGAAFGRATRWLAYLEAHPFPPEVRSSSIHLQEDVPEPDLITVVLRPRDATASAERTVRRHYRAGPGRAHTSLDVRSSTPR